MDNNRELMAISSKEELLERLIASGKLPNHITSVAIAYTVVEMGKELGLKPLQAMHQIIYIQGRLSLTAKCIGGILRREKISYTCTEDGMYLYPDGGIEKYKRTATNSDGIIIRPFDRRTTIRFTRDGVSEDIDFSIRDAELQLLTTKDNWIRMPKEMLYARCLSKGAVRIAPDYMMGLYSTDEMWDSLGQVERVIRDEDGSIVALADIPHEVLR